MGIPPYSEVAMKIRHAGPEFSHLILITLESAVVFPLAFLVPEEVDSQVHFGDSN